MGESDHIAPAAGNLKVGLLLSDEYNDDEPAPPPPKQTISSADLTKLLQERLQLYEMAKQAADKVGDSGKSRR